MLAAALKHLLLFPSLKLTTSISSVMARKPISAIQSLELRLSTLCLAIQPSFTPSLIKMVGQTNEVVQSYLGGQVSLEQRPEWNFPETPQKPFQINRVAVKDSANLLATNLSVGEPFSVEVYYSVRKNQSRFWITVQCISEYGSTVFFSRDADRNPHLLAERERGNFISVFRFPASQSFSLNQGRYSLIVRIEQDPSIEATIPVFLDDPLKKFPHHSGIVSIGESWQNRPLIS